LITKALTSIVLDQYVSGRGESDYYGETLRKDWENYEGFLNKVVENLNDFGFETTCVE